MEKELFLRFPRSTDLDASLDENFSKVEKVSKPTWMNNHLKKVINIKQSAYKEWKKMANKQRRSQKMEEVIT